MINIRFPIENGTRKFNFVATKDEIKTIAVDFSAWAEANGSLTDALWSIESGTASIGTEDLTADFASAPVTFSDTGVVVLSVSAVSANSRETAVISVNVRDADDGCQDYS